MRRLALLLVAALPGCAGTDAGDDGAFLPRLSAYGFFAGALAEQKPAAGVIPYDVNAPLYSDGASKLRFLALPPGGKLVYDPSERWGFPDGATLIKTFFYPVDARDPGRGRRILETRLLAYAGGAWSAATYVWNPEQTEAERLVAGEPLAVDYLAADGSKKSVDYQVPSSSQCKECHLLDKHLWPIGPRTEQLNRLLDYGAGPENQITHLDRAGLLDTRAAGGALPAVSSLAALPDPFGSAPLPLRARSWLDANCAHCHNSRGYAASTALRLEMEITEPKDLGVCRPPVAAGDAAGGRCWDVVPGHPERSVMVFRIQSLLPKVKMPQLPLTTVDEAGLQLVSDWITGLPAVECAPPVDGGPADCASKK